MARSLFLAALAAGYLSVPSLAQTPTVQTLPTGFGTTEGNSSTSYPWNTTTLRVQQCYDSSHIKSVAPVLIQRLRFRANGSTTATWTGRTYVAATVRMSSSKNDWASLSRTFASNTGADVATVFSGNAVVTAQSTGGSSPQKTWYVDLKLTKPFLYTPQAGKDLLIDIGVNTITGGTSYFVDGASGTAFKCSRVYSTISATATTANAGNSSFAPIVEISYVPAKGVFAGFDATPRVGAGPLKVQFTDKTFTSNPKVTKWAWDFNGDKVIDSTVQNPSFTYASVGKTAQYSVTLTATDSSNASSTTTQTNYITVDPKPTADFSATPTTGKVPLIVKFKDLSIAATKWAWDFNGDKVTDSTVQNPTFPYVKPGVYTVTLTVSNVGGSDTVTKTGFITAVGATKNTLSADLLQYQFNEPRTGKVANTASTTAMPQSGTATSAATWQVAAGRKGWSGPEAGAGALGNSQQVNTGAPTKFSGDLTIMWWHKMRSSPGTSLRYFFGNGTFRCFTGGVAGTTLWFRGTTIGDIKASSTVQSGSAWQHVALVIDNANGKALWYVGGKLDSTTNFTKGSFSYSSTSTLKVGASSSSTSNTTPSSSAATRSYDMDDFRIYASVRSPAQIAKDAAHEVASGSSFDVGCAGTIGIPSIEANMAPVPGTAGFQLTVSGAESGKPGILVIGAAAKKAFGTVPLPLGLDFLYGTGSGCKLHVDFLLSVGAVSTGGSATIGLPLPAGLEGSHIYAQWLGFASKGAVSAGYDLNLQKK